MIKPGLRFAHKLLDNEAVTCTIEALYDLRSMKKGPTVLVLFALLSVTVTAQEKTDRQKAFLAGPVKEVASKSRSSMGEKPRGSGSAKSNDTVKYDISGHEIKRIMFSDYGFPIGVQSQRYSSDGVLRETIYLNEKGALEERTTYVYQVGKLIQILKYDAKRLLREKTARIYDDKGRLSSEFYYDPRIPRAKTIFSYDANGNVSEMSFFMADGTKAVAPLGPCFGGHRVVLTYDPKGQVNRKTVYAVDGSVKKSWQYQYNEKGLYSEYLQISGSSKVRYVFDYEYDARGNWIKQIITSETDSSTLELALESIKRATNSTEQLTVEEAKLLRDSRFHTTVTTREITYY